MEKDFLHIAKQVHMADAGCYGRLSTNEASKEATDYLYWTCLCLLCGAGFGRLRLGGENTVSTVLEVVLAESTKQHCSSLRLRLDVLAVSAWAFFSEQGKIPRVVGQVINEHTRHQRECGDRNRLTKVGKDQDYFVQHADNLYDAPMDTDSVLRTKRALYVLST